jgi:hypothetical protein
MRSARYDLAFWCRFFEDTRPLRARDAVQLMQMAYDEPAARAGIAQLTARQRECAARSAHLHTDAFQKRWGCDAAVTPANYAEVKAIAEKLAEDIRAQTPRRPKVAICIPSGRTWEAGTANSVAAMAAYSSMCGIDIAIMNVGSSMITHGRNLTVEMALKEKMDWLCWVDSDMKFGPDSLMRLMAWGKDIVGATYNRRVAPYGTLGKLKGSRPSEPLGDGLHEALLLPGGFLLVKADVYRKLFYPWYAEGYEWPGVDGLEKFKAMMRCYFESVPPEEALSSLGETEFGAWMRDNFSLGEGAEKTMILSEDLYFCRQARRAGYEIWCDLGLSYSMVHLGVLEVTTLKPEHQAAAALPAPEVVAEAAD